MISEKNAIIYYASSYGTAGISYVMESDNLKVAIDDIKNVCKFCIIPTSPIARENTE